MWIAKDWKDYELLDCGGGEKLERWDRQVLGAPRSPGDLGDGQDHAAVARRHGTLFPVFYRRRSLG